MQPVFITPIQIRFSDVDMFRHVNNTVYFQYFDLAKARYFAPLTGGKVTPEDIALVIANVNCDFIAPTFFTDTVEVETHVDHIGTRSLRLQQVLRSTESGQEKARCTTVMVAFDPVSMTTVDIPDKTRTLLEETEGHTL